MLLLPAIFEVCVGNVHLIIAAVVVLSFRWPALWAFPLFTKITPAVGILLDVLPAASGGAFLSTVGLMVAIFGVSFALNPTAWFEWVEFLTADPGGAELIVPRRARRGADGGLRGVHRPALAGGGGGVAGDARDLHQLMGRAVRDHPAAGARRARVTWAGVHGWDPRRA